MDVVDGLLGSLARRRDQVHPLGGERRLDSPSNAQYGIHEFACHDSIETPQVRRVNPRNDQCMPGRGRLKRKERYPCLPVADDLNCVVVASGDGAELAVLGPDA